MGQKQPPEKKNPLRVVPHYEAMSDKEIEEVIDILASLLADYGSKEE